MKNEQRLSRIIELVGEGNLATAEELITCELDERFQDAKRVISNSMIGSVLENEVTGIVKGLGEVTVDGTRGQIRAGYNNINEALQKASEFAAYCDGVAPSSYKSHLNESGTAIIVESKGSTCYEMPLEDGYIVNTVQVTSSDVLSFKRNGTLSR